MDATLAWHKHITDESQLAGLPESALALAADTAKSKDLEGWVFTLDFPSYLPIMTYADDRELRKETLKKLNSFFHPSAGALQAWLLMWCLIIF